MTVKRSLNKRIINALKSRTTDAIEYLRWQALRLRASIIKRNRPSSIKLGGFRIDYTDILSLYIEYKDIFRQGIYQFNTENKQPRIIDGGGCIGMSVLHFKKRYPDASITCFEPDPKLLKVLHRNINQNNLTDINVVPAGLAGHDGVVKFSSDGVDGGKIVDNDDATEQIDVVTLADHLEEPVDFVKLNIEGMELDVLEQVAENGKLRNINEMVLEYHGWPGGEQRLGKILDLLNNNGFRYLIHDFDRESGAASKPPFRYRPNGTWFCLIYAKKLEQSAADYPLSLAA